MLTTFNVVLFLRRKPQQVKYDLKRYSTPRHHKTGKSAPKFRARAPSNTELYEREVFGDKKDQIHSVD